MKFDAVSIFRILDMYVLCQYTGNTPPNATKENVISQLLEMIIQFWKKFQRALLNWFYQIQRKWTKIHNCGCTVALKETLKLTRHKFSCFEGFGVVTLIFMKFLRLLSQISGVGLELKIFWGRFWKHKTIKL